MLSGRSKWSRRQRLYDWFWKITLTLGMSALIIGMSAWYIGLATLAESYRSSPPCTSATVVFDCRQSIRGTIERRYSETRASRYGSSEAFLLALRLDSGALHTTELHNKSFWSTLNMGDPVIGELWRNEIVLLKANEKQVQTSANPALRYENSKPVALLVAGLVAFGCIAAVRESVQRSAARRLVSSQRYPTRKRRRRSGIRPSRRGHRAG